MYCTAATYVEAPEMLRETAELFAVDVDLLGATIAGTDRSAWTAPERATADAALMRLNAMLTRASNECDAYLRQRGYTLPLDAVQFPVLAVWARSIARYHVQPRRDLTSEQSGRVERDYRDAIKALTAISRGELSLGANDPLARTPAAANSSGVAVVSQPARFDDCALRGY
jgi:phage gp36-like protein